MAEAARRVRRSCPVCGGTTYTLFAPERLRPEAITPYSYASRKEPEFMCHELVRCRICHTVYAACPPDAETLKQAYSEADYDSSEEAECAARTYEQALSEILGGTPRNLAVDVGAGNGALLPRLRALGFRRVLGIEPSPKAIAAAPREIQNFMRQEMFEPESLQGGKASLICSFMTLEHLPDPAGFARTAFGLLEAGGMLVIVVHDYTAWLNRALGLRSPIIDIEHLQLFCPKAAVALLTGAGFGQVQVMPLRNRYPLRYWLRLSPLPVSVKRPMRSGMGKLGERQFACHVGNIMVSGKKERST